jgi:hypothetical protein
MTTLSLLLLVLCMIGLLVVLSVGAFLVLVKLGVIVREASRPTYQDSGDYRIDQGRDVRPEDDRA